jgi:hypothetical protein
VALRLAKRLRSAGAVGVVFSAQEMFVLGLDLFCGDDPWTDCEGWGRQMAQQGLKT